MKELRFGSEKKWTSLEGKGAYRVTDLVAVRVEGLKSVAGVHLVGSVGPFLKFQLHCTFI